MKIFHLKIEYQIFSVVRRLQPCGFRGAKNSTRGVANNTVPSGFETATASNDGETDLQYRRDRA